MALLRPLLPLLLIGHVHHSAFVILGSSFCIHHSSFLVDSSAFLLAPVPPFIIHHSTFIIFPRPLLHSAFIILRSSLLLFPCSSFIILRSSFLLGVLGAPEAEEDIPGRRRIPVAERRTYGDRGTAPRPAADHPVLATRRPFRVTFWTISIHKGVNKGVSNKGVKSIVD